MKRLTVLISALLALLLAVGCQSGHSPDEPVKYYYPNATISYGTEEGFLSCELREGKNKLPADSISEYLRGPVDSAFSSPFPNGTALVQYQLTEDTAYLILTDSYATLTGLDLSVANACLSMTVLELTGATNVSIRCESALIDGNTAVVLNRSSTLLYDSSKTTTPTEISTTATGK